MATLSEKVEMLRAQLGLSPDLNMVAVVDQALEQLGLEVTGSLIVKADACVQAIGVAEPAQPMSEVVVMGHVVAPVAEPTLHFSSAPSQPQSIAPAVQVMEHIPNELPRPRIYVTELVGGHTGVHHRRAGSAVPRLIEYPPIAELQAMDPERLQALEFTQIGWKARGGLDALKFWRNDGAESPFYGACPGLNGSAGQFGDLSHSFRTSQIHGNIRGVTVFWYQHDVTGLALLGEGGHVIAQEGPGSCRDGFGQRTFTFGPTEKLVGFKFYTDHCTPQLGCIIADMGTPQGGVVQLAPGPAWAPPRAAGYEENWARIWLPVYGHPDFDKGAYHCPIGLGFKTDRRHNIPGDCVGESIVSTLCLPLIAPMWIATCCYVPCGGGPCIDGPCTEQRVTRQFVEAYPSHLTRGPAKARRDAGQAV